MKKRYDSLREAVISILKQSDSDDLEGKIIDVRKGIGYNYYGYTPKEVMEIIIQIIASLL